MNWVRNHSHQKEKQSRWFNNWPNKKEERSSSNKIQE